MPKLLNQIFSKNIHDHFPFEIERQRQAKVLDRVAAWLLGPKKFFICEAPTGSGKSGIGIAAASFAKTLPPQAGFEPGAYVLSPQIALTAQYMQDFAKNGLLELKGRSNYFCPEHDMDCELAARTFETMHNRETCHGYIPAKDVFVNNPLGVCNFAYYVAETTTAHQLPDRNLMVCDEGHNIESLILSFCDTRITQKKLDEYDVPHKLPLFDAGDNKKALEWLREKALPALQAKQRDFERLFEEAKQTSNREARAQQAKNINAIENYIQRIVMFTLSDEPDEWFAWSDWDADRKKGTGDLIIKPLSGRYFADDKLFSKASKVLIMSATILDFGTYMRNLGIHPDDAELVAMDSEFPIENRITYFKPIGNMRQDDKKETLPLMAQELKRLMKLYSKEKGIVHTQSFANNKYFTDYLSSEGFSDRILTHVSGGPKGSRGGVIQDHSTKKDIPTVIFSPSMTEGLDLKDDLGRWGVITKVPYPALDPYVRCRQQRDPDWYLWLTALALVQATGRICRSVSDRGVMWILDSGFKTFLNKAKHKMPKYWRDAVVDLSKFS